MKITGTEYAQVPTNGDLGTLAFQNVDDVNITGGTMYANNKTMANIYNDTNVSMVKPTLNLDFVKSKTLDPRITFTRASTGAYYDGKTTALAEQNLLTYSNTFNNASWVATNGTVVSGVTDPVSGTTAFSFTASAANGTLYQTLSLSALSYTLSFYIQRVTGTGTINLTLDGTNFTAVTITGSWVRYTTTVTPIAGSRTIGIQVVTSGDAVNIYGAQLENRSANTVYTATTTTAITNYIPKLVVAANNSPRFDHNPITGECNGFMVESTSTNLLYYSSGFDNNSYWTKGNVTIVPSASVSPDGTQNAQLMVLNNTNAGHGAYQIVTLSAISYTFSFYAKYYGQQYIQLFVNSVNAYCNFDLINGTAGTPGGSGSPTANIISVGNGWYRCYMTFTPTAGANPLQIIASNSLTAGANPSLAGNGFSGYLLWGAQLENSYSSSNSLASSYIPTTSAQVTRATDFTWLTGINFSQWFSVSQGTLIFEYTSLPVGYSGLISNTSLSFWSLITTLNNPDNLIITYYPNYVATGNYYTPSLVPIGSNAIGINKNAFTYTRGSLSSLCTNGSTVTTNYSSFDFTNAITLLLGARGGNFTLRKVTFYPKRFSDLELQEISS
jgi:hypothetical protein